MRSVYVETSIISYLAARPSRDLIVSAHQEISFEWWRDARPRFDIYVSEVVVRECGGGDREVAVRRLEFIRELRLLKLTSDVEVLTRKLIEGRAVPIRAAADALHIAYAAAHGVDYLLTWNCKHIANAATRRIIERVCASLDFEAPTICTPEELMEV